MKPVLSIASLADAFDPRGRLSRRAYGRMLVSTAVAFVGLLCLAVWLAASDLRIAAILAFACNLILAVAIVTQTVRRLHDRNRSAWWLGAYVLAYLASFAPIEDAAERYPILVILATLGIVAFLLWFFAETFLLAGTPGPNRFGPEPDRAVTAPP